MTGLSSAARAATAPAAIGATARRLVLPLLGLPLLSGCLGDPPPPPETAPLEVVVGSSTRPQEPCQLARSELGAGRHDLLLISEHGPAVVVIRGPEGSVVFRGDAGPSAPAVLASVELAAGPHLVECTPAGGPISHAPLRVDPARPDR